MKAIVEVDIKNLEEVTQKLIKDLQKKVKSLERKLDSRESTILKLDQEIRDMIDDKATFDRIKESVRCFAEEFGFRLEDENNGKYPF